MSKIFAHQTDTQYKEVLNFNKELRKLRLQTRKIRRGAEVDKASSNDTASEEELGP
jgi:ABC-type phosphate transport system auxiliary subunit